MIGLFVLLGNERTKRMTFKRSPLTIGDAGENQLVLRDGEVARHHVTIELDEDERWHVTAHAPIAIAGKLHDRSTTRIPVNNGTRISLGTYTLQLALAAELALHPVEQRLLAELAAHDEASRLVYADWLEEVGEHARAEFLRTEDGARLRELAVQVDDDWRRKVSRPPIEHCVGFEGRCPGDWGALDATRDPEVRACATCHQAVHYCHTELAARQHRLADRRVAVDVRAQRR